MDHQINHNLRHWIGYFVCFIGLALAGCGGGGSGSDGESKSEVPSSQPVKFSSANYIEASKEAVSAVSQIRSINAVALGVSSLPADWIFRQATFKIRAAKSGSSRTNKPIASGVITEDLCEISGSVTFDETALEDAAYKVGDTGTVTYKNCKENGPVGAGVVTWNGVAKYKVLEISSDETSGLDEISYENLSFASDLQGATLVGKVNVAYTPNSESYVVIDKLTASIKFSTATATSWTYSSSFRMDYIDEGSNGFETLSFNRKASSANLGSGSITYKTIKPLKIKKSETYPTEFVLELTADGGGKTKIETITAGGPNARISLDEGEGVFKTNAEVPWTDILGK